MELLIIGGRAYLTRSEWAWHQFSDLPEGMWVILPEGRWVTKNFTNYAGRLCFYSYFSQYGEMAALP